MRISSRTTALAVAVLGALLIVGTRAEADPLKCMRTINKESAKYAQAKMKALSKCEEAILKGKIPGPCPDPGDGKALAKIAKAATKMKEKVEKACGGGDKLCSTRGDNDPLADIGWDIGACPDIEQPDCSETVIHDCAEIGTCLACVNEKAVDQAIELYYGALVPTTPGDDLNKCQIAIGKETAKFFKAKSKILLKCEDALLKGKDGFNPALPCPAADTSGKSQEKLTKAETKKVAGICKKCGGPDKLCDGVGDFTPAEIGFAASCPAVQVPGGGQDCGAIGTVDTLAKLVDCVDCVTEFKADCLDALAVPNIKAYPPECSVCTVPAPASGLCPTSVQIDVKGGDVNLDTGFTGLSHDAQVAVPSRVTLTVSNCAGTDHPNCGECDLGGPIPNAGGSAIDNQRCHGNTAVHCTSDADCDQTRCKGGPNDRALCSDHSECPGGACQVPGGPCRFLFGAPLPLSAGSVAVCVFNEVTEPVTGTIDVENATSAALVKLTSEVSLGSLQHRPCPICEGGVCSGGFRGGLPCEVSATSALFGNVSFDCQDDPGANIGHLPITLDLKTGLQTWSLSAASPNCSGAGFTGGKCFCDSCATAAAEPCASNADCPGGAICGGRRCIGGANDGTPCTNNSECPGVGAACSIRGRATQWNECLDTVCSPNPSDTDTIDEGICEAGPFEQFCAIETFRGCFSDGDCVNVPGDSCAPGKFRQCFTDNGVIGTHCFGGANDGAACSDGSECPGGFCGGGSISISGEAGTICGLKADAAVGTIFCVQQTANASPNSVSGLPGPGRVAIPVRTTFDQ